MKCDRCGREGADWLLSIVSEKDGRGRRHKLCLPCAMGIAFAVQKMIGGAR